MNLKELIKEVERLISLKTDNPHSVVNLRLQSIRQTVEAYEELLSKAKFSEDDGFESIDMLTNIIKLKELLDMKHTREK